MNSTSEATHIMSKPARPQTAPTNKAGHNKTMKLPKR